MIWRMKGEMKKMRKIRMKRRQILVVKMTWWIVQIGYQIEIVHIDIDYSDPLNKYFGNKVHEARNIGFFIEDVLIMDEGVTNPRFIQDF